MRVSLTPHPQTPSSAIDRIEVDVERVSKGTFIVTYRGFGDLTRLRIPKPQPSGRVDELWRHTCFEVFVKGEGGTYYEVNLSPSSQWAAYRFDSYRTGMIEVPIEPWSMARLEQAGELELMAEIELGALASDPWTFALSAVIEDIDGSISYWALAHPSDKPDFHHPDSFTLVLPAPEQP